MPDVTWTHPALPSILDAMPLEFESLIDLGCGRGIMGALCRIYRDPKHLVGVDAHEPSVEFCTSFGLYDKCLVRDLRNLPLPFRDDEFDVATCIEVVEHLPREAGDRLVDEIERIAHVTIISTPNVFSRQPEYDENPNQRHLSRWFPRDFRKRGYRVHGVGDMVFLGRKIRYLSRALGPVTKHAPALSSLLLCVRDRGGF